MKTIYRITTRFDLSSAAERRAVEYLKGLKHGEGNRFVIDAVLARIDGSADEKLLAQIRQMFREEVKTIPAAIKPVAPVAQAAEPQADMSVLDDLKMFD